jgi:hypothetical protein
MPMTDPRVRARVLVIYATLRRPPAWRQIPPEALAAP